MNVLRKITRFLTVLCLLPIILFLAMPLWLLLDFLHGDGYKISLSLIKGPINWLVFKD